VLSNWATFYKNIVLLLLAGVTFYWHDLHLEIFGRHTSRWSAYWCFLFPLLLSAFSYRHLPIIDFRPYKIGNRLADLMKVPAGAPTDSFETRFIYEKQGVKQEFPVEKAPVSDSTWTYVDRIEKQIRKGYTPPIHDFVVEHPKRGDITQEILNDTSYTFLLVSPNLEKANRESSDRIGAVQDYAGKHGYAFYGLTNSDAGVIDEWNYEYDSDIEYCSVDQQTLQTMIRSNPGLMLLKNGVVYQKWAFTDIPDLSKMKEPLDRLPFGKERVVSIMRNLVNIFLIYLVPLMFFYLVHTGHHFHFNFMKKKNLNNA
jgi:hypothetical protein